MKLMVVHAYDYVVMMKLMVVHAYDYVVMMKLMLVHAYDYVVMMKLMVVHAYDYVVMMKLMVVHAYDYVVMMKLMVVHAYDYVPADSRVNEGEIEIDEAALTGESLPVTKFQGSKCLMGSSVVRGEVEDFCCWKECRRSSESGIWEVNTTDCSKE